MRQKPGRNAATHAILRVGWLMSALGMASSSAETAAAARFYVALGGRDTWSGRLPNADAAGADGPFATLHRARDAVRSLKQRDGLKQPVTVMVRAGTHYLVEPLVLGPEDSGAPECAVTYCAYPGESVVLSGGRRIRGPWSTGDGRIHHTRLPDVQAGKWYFRQLRVGMQRQTRARFPNADPDEPYLRGFHLVPGAAGGFRVGLGCLQERGTWLEYDIEVPADAEYTIRVYYANSGSTNMRFFKFTDMSSRTSLSFDGREPVPLADLTDTGSFYSGFRWSLSGKVRLTRGRHVARWHNTQGGALSLLAFMLCDDPQYAPGISAAGRTEMPRAGRHVVVFQAEKYQRKHGELVQQMTFADRHDPVLRTNFAFEPGALEAWPRSPDAEIFVIPEYDWVNQIVRLVSVDTKACMARVEGANCTKPFMPGNRFYAVNVLEKLDTPGEWCLVRGTGTLHYWPKSKAFAKEDIVAPYLDRVMELRGDAEHPVSHVRIEGFTFADTRFTAPERIKDTYHADDAALWLWAAQHCRVAGNTFQDVGGYGVMLRDASTHNEIVENEVVGAGQGGIYLNGFADEPRKRAAEGHRPAHNVVAGNHVHHCGKFYVHVAGIYLACAEHNRLAHNYIHDMTRYGISLKQRCPGNVVEYNEVRRTNLATRDTGAIEMCNQAGSIVRYNLVVDAVGCGFSSRAGRHTVDNDAGGIYLDNMTSKVHVYGNIVVRTSQGVWLNWGSDNLIENNVFVGSRDRGVLLNAWLDRKGWRSKGNRFVRNIVYSQDPHVPSYWLSGTKHTHDVLQCDQNLVYAGGNAPSLGGRAPSTWDAWRAAGQDASSIVADPLFVDPDQDDYRLQPDSPAHKMGFEPIDTSRIGLKGYRRE